MLAVLTLLTGVVYPLAITAIARIAFPSASRGSLVMEGDKATMSRVIGQPFNDPKYFWGRPSATTPSPYDAESSGGSNLGPTNPDLHTRIAARIAALRAVDPGNTAAIPVDLVTASASGLDPHISPAAAAYQLARVARVRGLSEERVRELVRVSSEGRDLGVLGEPRVNVGLLNLALDRVK
ncbi:MAG: potassium-transporting ATPase subunit KdpC [Polyangiaceae bacterium]|nr:potassium-transporting ATPase subunit KdpC [Polyangiaceae bacterium]